MDCAGPPDPQSSLSRPAQVTDNAFALDLALAPEHRAALDAVSAPDTRMLYSLFTPAMRRQVVFGGDTVRGWPC